MLLSKEKRFLYTRITILAAFLGAFWFFAAGFNGLPFWYGGFALFSWVALGLLNLKQKSSLWLLANRPLVFLLFYFALASIFYFGDQFGLNSHLWFYPFYQGWGLLLVWLLLYPFGGLAVLELLYFLAGCLGKPLRFNEFFLTKWHRLFDAFECGFFLLMMSGIILGAIWIGGNMSVSLTVGIIIPWVLLILFKLRLHISDFGQYLLVIILSVMFGVMFNATPNAIAHEWVYLEAPFLSFLILGIPLWMWICSFLLTLIPLRLWMFVAQNQTKK